MMLKTQPVPVGNIPAMLAQSRQERALLTQEQARKQDRHNRGTAGKREDLGLYVRSSYEANYARWLNYQIAHNIGGVASWQYEPCEFEFHEIKRGIRFYRPDFLVEFHGSRKAEFHEIKGWMDAPSKTKLARMAKYYPDEIVLVIDGQQMSALSQLWGKVIPHWE